MTTHPSHPPLVVFVDVDDTLIRSVGTTRMPMPATIAHVRALKIQGAVLFCWSSGGAEYAQASAEELGIADCFQAFLPKPHVLLDDQPVADWRYTLQVHPNIVRTTTVADYWRQLHPTHAVEPS